MNVKNNQRTKDTELRVETIFLSLLSKKHISKITVRELCESANITRTSFYAHYEDVYDLLNKIEHKITSRIIPFFTDEATHKTIVTKESFIKLFRFIAENKNFYLYYFQNTDAQNLITLKHLSEDINITAFNSKRKYRVAFFMGGLNAIIKQWLSDECSSTPLELVSILEEEYGDKNYLAQDK